MDEASILNNIVAPMMRASKNLFIAAYSSKLTGNILWRQEKDQGNTHPDMSVYRAMRKDKVWVPDGKFWRERAPCRWMPTL
ncbi:hypothetical protein EST38_g1980 [Candolleomyces aberdarensis]|uniref:Uncharacterized protein n=1 Tax=Candolleomyces aberdarensis TaxID=2316362 RepID=A0A4V1Q501_9AGAR|nr:hypothetical protein EST38_g1980 [Candolleomyces aberdarensis]